MNLSYPVTIQLPDIVRPNGETIACKPFVLSKLDMTIIDNPDKKRVTVRIYPCFFPLVLWTNDEYTAIGDYTQNQVESRILELLGDNPKAVLESLCTPPAPIKNK